MQAVAVDYAGDEVRANCIAPGTGETGMTNELLESPTVKEAFLASNSVKRLGKPEDVAEAALFLASEQASYTSDAVLPVAGGWAMSCLGRPRRRSLPARGAMADTSGGTSFDASTAVDTVADTFTGSRPHSRPRPTVAPRRW